MQPTIIIVKDVLVQYRALPRIYAAVFYAGAVQCYDGKP